MILALTVPFFWSLSIIGLGHVFLKYLFPKHFAKIPSEQCLIGGLFAIVFMAQIYHLFFRISLGFSMVSFVLGLAVFLKTGYLRKNFFLYVYLVIVSVCMAPHLVMPMKIYDSGLYHLQSILWYLEGPLVRGLANVHTRLGFNSNFSLLAGVLFPFKNLPQGFPLVNGVLASVVFLPLFREMYNAWKGRRVSIPSLYLLASSAYVISNLYNYSNDLGTDLPVKVLAIASFYFLLQYLEREQFGYLIILSLAFALGVTFKLSLAPYCLLMLFLSVKYFSQKRSFALLYALPALLAAVWCYRFYVMSGCWIVPMAETCTASAQWAVSVDEISHTYDWIKSWAKHPGPEPGHVMFDNFRWFSLWFENNIYLDGGNTLLLTFSALAFAYFTARCFLRKDSHLGILFFIHILAISYWFFTAPDFRFGAFYFVVLSAHAASVFIDTEIHNQMLNRMLVLIGGITVLIFTILPDERKLSRIRRGLKKTIPHVETVDYYKTKGIVFKHPLKGDQCWATPVPCTTRNEGAFFVEKKNGIITTIGKIRND